MKRPRRNHAPTFKAKVALAALNGDRTLVELAQQFAVHPIQITQRKSQFLERRASCAAILDRLTAPVSWYRCETGGAESG